MNKESLFITVISVLGLIICLFLGGIIGCISGFLGLGGGILIVPLLPLVVKISHHEVIATSLFSILLIVVNNSYFFNKKKLVCWPLVLTMGPMTGAASFFAAKASLSLDELTLKLTLLIVLFCFGMITFFRKTPEKHSGTIVTTGKLEKVIWFFLLASAMGAGAMSGLTGIGSGLILGLVLLNSRALPNDMLSPTSNGIMIFTTAMGILPFFFSGAESASLFKVGYIHLDVGVALVAGAILSSHYSRKSQHLLSLNKRKYSLTLLIFLLCAKIGFSIS